MPGEDLKGVSYVCNPDDATRIREGISKGEVGNAVIIGAGFIGLEMAEAFADMWGVETSVVEITGQIMPRLVSPALAAMGQRHMEENGINFYFGETVKSIEGEDGRVTRVVTDKRTLDADAVIIAAGVVPCSDIAKEAGLAVHERGGVFVDEHMRTDDPDIYAGGDCCIVKNLITDTPAFLPLGSMANRQGRVIGTNLAGGEAVFDGVVGSFVVKLFETSMAGTGLSLDSALAAGFDAVSVLLVQLDRAHFYPTKELMTLEMVVDRKTAACSACRASAAPATPWSAASTPWPPSSSSRPPSRRSPTWSWPTLRRSPRPWTSSTPWPTWRTTSSWASTGAWGRTASRRCGTSAMRATSSSWTAGKRRTPPTYLERNPGKWHNVPQGKIYEKLDEIPKDRPVVLICNTGARSYEAQIMLTDRGYEDVTNVQGGMAAIKKYGVEL